jgi:formate dehydrogenase assembly factor FdhD
MVADPSLGDCDGEEMVQKTLGVAVALVLSSSIATADDVIRTDSAVTTSGSMTTTIKSPPPSAISPTFSGGSNSNLCTVGVAGAVQTQILGISMGTVFTDSHCIRLTSAKTMYDMGMKVAAVSLMCQDENIFRGMMDAGTPCPYDGLIGPAAKAAWETHEEKVPVAKRDDSYDFEDKKVWAGIGGLISILAGLLLL